MKTYRQKLNKWLEEKKTTTFNDDAKKIINEIQEHIKSVEKEEEDMVNRAYETGYYDKESNKGIKTNYYKHSYKIHDLIKKWK